MREAIDLTSVPEQQRAAYYGILFALAEADGSFSPEEMAAIHSVLDLSGFSEPTLHRIRSYRVRSPNMTDCLVTLAEADPELRYGVLMSLVDVALADDVVSPGEREALLEARMALGVEARQLSVMEEFVQATKSVRRSPGDETYEALRRSAATLAATEVPLSAAYFTATVNALNDAGDEHALNAIGLGMGRVPGSAVSVLVGVTAQVAVSDLLHPDGRRSDRSPRRERAQQALVHLEKSINDLVERADAAQDAGEASELQERCAGLKQLMRTRRSALEE